MDSIEAYFKDEACYTKTLNNNIELHISFETGEVVGMNILNVQQLIRDKGHFQ
jgi:hydroxymethylglutaryl-CoA reductase